MEVLPVVKLSLRQLKGGKLQAAVKHYEKVLEAWKEAGRGLTEVLEARRRLAALWVRWPAHILTAMAVNCLESNSPQFGITGYFVTHQTSRARPRLDRPINLENGNTVSSPMEKVKAGLSFEYDDNGRETILQP